MAKKMKRREAMKLIVGAVIAGGSAAMAGSSCGSGKCGSKMKDEKKGKCGSGKCGSKM
ncbi:HvfA family oxazolone/thioamide-modified RiPP metallophore [Nitratifractor sp.]